MIQNEQEFEQAIEQMERMYRALAAFRLQKEKMHPQQYAVMLEGPVEEIRHLRHEIDAYLGVTVGSPGSA